MTIDKFTATLRGIRPILFDRYPGDNTTQLSYLEKLNTDSTGGVVLPVLSVFSLLSAQNTMSVPNRFYGKMRKNIAASVLGFCEISSFEEGIDYGVDATPIYDETGKKWCVNDQRIREVHHVARVKGGVPQAKHRPMIPPGWFVKLNFALQENKDVTPKTLKNMIVEGGMIGLGTFRPIFGRYAAEIS